jgi:monoamine oxidase
MTSNPIDSSKVNGTTTEEHTASTVQEYDVIIVGAGFSGISALHRLRKEGLKAHIFESGTFPLLCSFPKLYCQAEGVFLNLKAETKSRYLQWSCRHTIQKTRNRTSWVI